VEVHVSGKAVELEQIVDLDLLGGGFSPGSVTVRPGRHQFHVNNRFKKSTGVILQNASLFMSIASPHMGKARRWRPFLTGKAFLNNQSFRELFRVQAWAPDMKLKIKSLTILFTDLKGSTDMYGRVGDITAFDVVQKHFDLLTEVVRAHRGAIVKTMGDAIMATFSNSADGVLAALDMVHRMKSLNVSAGQTELGIKIGVHEGAALAVNADERLDYFGQNVNLAARVQGLAEAGEVWLTEEVYQSAGVLDIVTASKLNTEPKLATLKGIAQPTPVYRLWG
jgi:class 3 adenylate cyclase